MITSAIAWITANIGFVVFVVVVALLILKNHKEDAINLFVTWFPRLAFKFGLNPNTPDTDGEQPAPVPMESAEWSISEFLTKLSDTKIAKFFDMSRESIVRSFFATMLVRMSNWCQQELTGEELEKSVAALKVLSEVIVVKTPAKDPPLIDPVVVDPVVVDPPPAPVPVQRERAI